MAFLPKGKKRPRSLRSLGSLITNKSPSLRIVNRREYVRPHLLPGGFLGFPILLTAPQLKQADPRAPLANRQGRSPSTQTPSAPHPLSRGLTYLRLRCGRGQATGRRCVHEEKANALAPFPTLPRKPQSATAEVAALATRRTGRWVPARRCMILLGLRKTTPTGWCDGPLCPTSDGSCAGFEGGG